MPASAVALREDKLIEKSIGLVHYVLRREFSGLGIEYEDAVQIGLEALLKAARSYDSKQGAFSSWAIPHIRNALLSEYQFLRRKKRKAPHQLISLDAPISDDDERTIEVADHRQNPESDAIALISVERLVQRLGAVDQKIVGLLRDGATIAEISRKTGIDRFSLNGRIQKMRSIIEEEKHVNKPDNAGDQGAKESLSTMNSFLFAQLERLGSKDLTGEQLREEVIRAKAVADISTRIIQSSELVLRAHVFRDKQVDTSSQLPKLLSGNE